MSKTIVALDCMGGDNAPFEIVKGAVEATNENKDILVKLVGVEEQIKEELSKYKYNSDQLEIVNATEIIETGEPPVAAIREKTDSSLVKCLYMVKKGEADGMVSAGSGRRARSGVYPHLHQGGASRRGQAADGGIHARLGIQPLYPGGKRRRRDGFRIDVRSLLQERQDGYLRHDRGCFRREKRRQTQLYRRAGDAAAQLRTHGGQAEHRRRLDAPRHGRSRQSRLFYDLYSV